jgi:hypothetical protein
VLVPFVKEGLDAGEKAFHIVNPEERANHLSRLAESGIDVSQALERGQLEVATWDETYLDGARFQPDRMLAVIEKALIAGRAAGYTLTRLVGEMPWPSEPRPGTSERVEYEARLNDLLAGYDDPVVCLYELGRFSTDVIIDILRTHPVVVLGGALQHNPFFVSPAELLREMRERGPRSDEGSERW